MKNKSFFFTRERALNTESATLSAYDESYQFGVDFQVLAGAPTMTLVVEQTADGGYTWTNVVTFTLDTAGSISTPQSSPVMISGNALRARITAVGGTGEGRASAWVR
jgi:hypothetical protein